MNLDMAENPVRVVLDTNIIVSAIIFKGKPLQVLDLILRERLKAITSPILLAELKEILTKKFKLPKYEFELAIKNIEEIFEIIQPKISLNILKADPDDDRVLEAASEGHCDYIVTGDREILSLGTFKNIQIVTADEFLKILL